MPNRVTYIECLGRCEILRIDHDDELRTVDLSIFTDHPTKHGWRSRLRWIWKMLRTGEPFGDYIMLGEEGMAKLVAALIPDTTAEGGSDAKETV